MASQGHNVLKYIHPIFGDQWDDITVVADVWITYFSDVRFEYFFWNYSQVNVTVTNC